MNRPKVIMALQFLLLLTLQLQVQWRISEGYSASGQLATFLNQTQGQAWHYLTGSDEIAVELEAGNGRSVKIYAVPLTGPQGKGGERRKAAIKCVFAG